jgi:hypothetical protein
MFSLLCLTTCITSFPPSGGEAEEEVGRRRERITVQLLDLTGGLATSSGILPEVPGIENITQKIQRHLLQCCASHHNNIK